MLDFRGVVEKSLEKKKQVLFWESFPMSKMTNDRYVILCGSSCTFAQFDYEVSTLNYRKGEAAKPKDSLYTCSYKYGEISPLIGVITPVTQL